MSRDIKVTPPRADQERDHYLSKKLEEMRKDCQWLLGLGAIGVLGAMLKDSPDAPSAMRTGVAFISILQILISMAGAMSWNPIEVDEAQFTEKLHGRLRLRYWIRNVSIALLALSYVLLIVVSR